MCLSGASQGPGGRGTDWQANKWQPLHAGHTAGHASRLPPRAIEQHDQGSPIVVADEMLTAQHRISARKEDERITVQGRDSTGVEPTSRTAVIDELAAVDQLVQQTPGVATTRPLCVVLHDREIER